MRNCQPLVLALLCGSMLQGLVGCARWDCNSRRESWETELRTLADAAYQSHFGEAAEGCSDDYGDGWTEGYYQVLGGHSGEPPVVPNSRYWEPQTRHVDQLHRVAQWRRGFTDGAAAAHACGQHGYATVPAAAPAAPQHVDRPIYTVDCFTSLAPDGMLNAPAGELPPMPMPLPPTQERLDGQPGINPQPEVHAPPETERLPEIERLPELDYQPDSQDLLPSPSDLPRTPLEAQPAPDDPLLGTVGAPLDAAFARLQTASRRMRQAAPVQSQNAPRRLPRVAEASNTAVVR
ncbi:hypothetical protein [Roseimaritima ulvae]|uniref:hypothetical protein n=1 Tax=Roseimaritima ulvae TaxID=980254 RepID=UPI0011CDE9A4|nr:hypothetical protein [Roseimaritima ulvae]